MGDTEPEGLKWRDFDTNPATKYLSYSLSYTKSILGQEPSRTSSKRPDFIQELTGADALSHSQTLDRTPRVMWRRETNESKETEESGTQ